MKPNADVAQALNRQINNELQASYVYLAMAAYFDGEELHGFGAWFRGHANEEVEHAMKLYDFMVKRGARVALSGVAEPKAEHDGPAAALEAALAMEGEVTGQIYALFETAHESKEFGSQPLLHWFLEEQVNEEDLFRGLLDQVRAAADSRWHLLALDAQLAERAGA